MKILKRLGAVFFALALALSLAAVVWLNIPVPSALNQTDPSINFANKHGGGGAQFTGEFIQYNGNNMHYVSAGEGEVVLFLHGFPSYWYSLVRPMTALKEDYRVVAIDGLGKGLSDVPEDDEAYTMDNMTAHIKALIDHLGEEKVHLVGHDWGTGLAFGLAQLYPERIKTLTMMSAPPQSVLVELITSKADQRKTFSYIDYFRQANPLLLWGMNVEESIWQTAFEPLIKKGQLQTAEGEFFRHAASDPKRVNAHINWYKMNIPKLDDITEKDYWPHRKATVATPSLFIWGKDDFLINADTITELKSVVPNLTTLELDGVGHRPQFENPEAVSKAIRALLERH